MLLIAATSRSARSSRRRFRNRLASETVEAMVGRAAPNSRGLPALPPPPIAATRPRRRHGRDNRSIGHQSRSRAAGRDPVSSDDRKPPHGGRYSSPRDRRRRKGELGTSGP